MKLLVFLHGTTLMHAGAKDKTRSQIVAQVKAGEASVYNYASYVPIGSVVLKLKSWQKQGAKLAYLSSHKISKNIAKDKLVLTRSGFPHAEVFYRRRGEEYKSVVEWILPDVLIEDDCESIGGKKEMAYTHLKPSLKKKIKLIKVKEFGGVDHLPDNLAQLLVFKS